MWYCYCHLQALVWSPFLDLIIFHFSFLREKDPWMRQGATLDIWALEWSAQESLLQPRHAAATERVRALSFFETKPGMLWIAR